MSGWKEKSRCKVFYGVEATEYDGFLDNFCMSAKIDKLIRKDFEQLHRVDKMNDNKKVFTLKGTQTSGTYGMYVAVKTPEVFYILVLHASCLCAPSSPSNSVF